MSGPEDERTAEMFEGYVSGFEDTRLELAEGVNRSDAWCFGWRNGRDDRIGQPRATAAVLREMGTAIIEGCRT